MKAREAGQIRSHVSQKQSSIASTLTLTVLPIAVLTLLLGLFLIWSLVSADGAEGFSWADAGAIGLGVVVVAISIGTLAAVHLRSSSISERVDEVSSAARRVANKDLVDLLDALRNPDTDPESITPMKLDSQQDDEVGELAHSFEELHGSLVEVGARQMEALRAGVSSIFVTLARRNSSLVDRQLALLDGLESREEDPEVLAGFYQLDHLAARMRRNAESLLVLAGSESPRVWAKATDMSDVVRAAISEIDEYQRIEVLALEPARLSGGAVSDVSHLIAELLENAIQFSPPSEMIRVTGLFAMDGYQVAISDRGVGMSEARIAEMNRILERPPALGLAVEPTLGLYVVAKLAHRHSLDVELIRGVPGITARVTVPRDHLEVDEEPVSRPWDERHTELVAAEHGRSRSTDQAETVAREHTFERSEETPARGRSDDVIDLTRNEFAEPVEHSRPADLPVRKPGSSFSDDDEDAPAVSPGEGASRIKSALSAYDQGRRSAVDAEEAGSVVFRDDSNTEEES